MDHYLFLLKKFLGNLLMPVPITLLLLIWALLLLLRRKTRWLGIIVVLLATTLLFVASYAPISNQYISKFESQIPSYQQGQTPVDYIAVLGSWHQSVDDQPVTSELKPTAVVRLAEGIRIYHLNPGSKLIFTGFKGLNKDPVSYPEKLRELALALGVPTEDILIFNGPRDTMEEAELIAANFSATSLVLVTTAVHMPRALKLFHKVGLDPFPAPTEHLSKPFKSWWNFPAGSTLAHSEYWAHEQLGLLWVNLTGQVENMVEKESN
ncbi:MAG: ElyC/SanA/YdcF family protein [Thermodesulfobacteriota bacterium]|nr:ElyC/SanA/YdcF family protein [Thermodesulfobacteriota bacterium]